MLSLQQLLASMAALVLAVSGQVGGNMSKAVLTPQQGQVLGASTAFTGPLKVSSNGRYFTDANGNPFFWMGDTPWTLFTRYSPTEATAYLDDRQAKGFTVVQAVLCVWPGSNCGPNTAGQYPFLNGNPATPNDLYFNNVDSVIDAANARGIAVAMLPVWGSSYVSGSATGGSTLVNISNARAYGRYLGNRYKDKGNVIWLLGGDTAVYDKSEVYRELAAGIRENDTQAKILGYHPSSTNNWPYWSTGATSDQSMNPYTIPEANLSFNMSESYKWYDKIPYLVNHMYSASPTKPAILGEGSYEYGSVDTACCGSYPAVTAKDIRKQAYWTYLGGGFYTYGNDAIWSHGDNGGTTWSAALNAPGAQSMSVAKSFFTTKNWWQMVPDSSIFVNGAASGLNASAAARMSDWSSYIVYVSNTNSFSLNLTKITAGTKVKASWMDPRSGALTAAGTFTKSSSQSFTPPSGFEDAVLVLDGVTETAPVTIIPPGTGESYLSDLSWTQISNGWGPVERNMSNGENQTGDGSTLSISGVSYAKGLGTHASSDVRYSMNGGCTSFSATVGIDDEIKNTPYHMSSVVFQVFADGAKLFDSGTMTQSSQAQTFAVNVSGKNTLQLVVTDAGDGNGEDHADWADAKIACGTSNTGTTPAPTTGDINVKNYGATGNGYAYDNSAINSAISACTSGQTVFFPEGTYLINGSISLKSGCSLLGVSGKSVIKAAANGAMLLAPTSLIDSKIRNLVLDGANVAGDLIKADWMSGVQITGNIFKNTSGRAVFSPGSVSGNTASGRASISGNTILSVHMPFQTYDKVSDFDFNGNYIDTFHQGLAIPQGNGSNVSIQNNTFLRGQRMAIEIMYFYNNLNVSGNYIADWRASPNPSGENYSVCGASYPYMCDSMAISIATGGSKNVISNNKIYRQKGTSWGIEYTVTGSESVASGNVIKNSSYPIFDGACSDCGVTRANIVNNIACGGADPNYNYFSNFPSATNRYYSDCSNANIPANEPVPAMPVDPNGGVVTPVAPPSISSFTASPSSITAGQSAALGWSVSNATNLSIDNGVGAVNGLTSKTVAPSQTTTYTLTATNSGGTATRSVTVAVASAPAPTPAPSTKFSMGQRVQTTSNLNVRGAASVSGALMGSQSLGALGTILSGGQFADGYYWWNVDYDNAPDGYSIEDYLSPYTEPASGSEWVFCAYENQVCNFSGTKEVRYGADGFYNYKVLVGPVDCNNATFGDPISEVYKSCSYRDTNEQPSAPADKFMIGDRIHTTSKLKVRSTPSTSGKSLCTQPINSYGTVIAGPKSAGGYIWWQVNYDKLCDGWSVQNWLVK